MRTQVSGDSSPDRTGLSGWQQDSIDYFVDVPTKHQSQPLNERMIPELVGNDVMSLIIAYGRSGRPDSLHIRPELVACRLLPLEAPGAQVLVDASAKNGIVRRNPIVESVRPTLLLILDVARILPRLGAFSQSGVFLERLRQFLQGHLFHLADLLHPLAQFGRGLGCRLAFQFSERLQLL